MSETAFALLNDCLSIYSIPTGTVNAALSKMMTSRYDMLREIILSEIRQGNFENVNQDDLVSVFFRIIRDAQEGVARTNLCLLAKVINGMAEKDELKAPNFLKYANIL